MGKQNFTVIISIIFHRHRHGIPDDNAFRFDGEKEGEDPGNQDISDVEMGATAFWFVIKAERWRSCVIQASSYFNKEFVCFLRWSVYFFLYPDWKAINPRVDSHWPVTLWTLTRLSSWRWRTEVSWVIFVFSVFTWAWEERAKVVFNTNP